MNGKLFFFSVAIFNVIANGKIIEDESVLQVIKNLVETVSRLQNRIDQLERSEKQLKESVSVLIGTNARFRLQLVEIVQQLGQCQDRGVDTTNDDTVAAGIIKITTPNTGN